MFRGILLDEIRMKIESITLIDAFRELKYIKRTFEN